MNSNLRLTITKPRSGRTPMSGSRSAVKTPQISLSPQTETKNALTSKQKLELIDNVANNYSRDEFEKLIQTIDSDDEGEVVIGQRLLPDEVAPQTCPTSSSCVVKNLQSHFDLVSDSFAVGRIENAEVDRESNEWDFEGHDVPECLTRIREGMSLNSEWNRLRKEKLDAEHTAESSEYLKFDTMITEMEKNVIPALNKLLKEPARFHDLIRKDPLQTVLPCNIEDQKTLIEYVVSLSDVCHQLHNVDIGANDLDKELEFLRELANLVDGKMNTKAAEKLRLHNMEKLLKDYSVNTTDSTNS